MGREKGRRKKQEEKTALGCLSCRAKIPSLREIQPENLTVAGGNGEREEKAKRTEREWRVRWGKRDSDDIV